jgi:hypothetical protein
MIPAPGTTFNGPYLYIPGALFKFYEVKTSPFCFALPES